MEKIVESLLYASRWVLAPIYLGLSIALLLLGIKFFQEALHTLPLVLELKEADLVLVTLSLVDMALVGGLLGALLAAGASIDEINTVRKHLSAIKGGRLALAARSARVVTGDQLPPSVVLS